MSEFSAALGRQAGAPLLLAVVPPVVTLLSALVCFSLAGLHPLAPALAMGFLCGCMVWAAWQPSAVGLILAALLPVASMAPATGWWLIEEFDLLALAIVAGGYGRWSFDIWVRRSGRAPVEPPGDDAGRGWARLPVLLAGSGLLSLVIGLQDGGAGARALMDAVASGDGLVRALHADHASVFNAVRVSKSLLWASLILPLMNRGGTLERRRVAHLTVAGLACGLALVCALVAWERLRYVGLFNFTDSYRTVASFWEMHVGGGAIDAFLAMTVPVAFWAVWLAPGGWRWAAAAILALLGTYAVLTTYSRGLYLALAVSLVFMVLAARYHHIRPSAGERRRRWALGLLALVLVFEAAWVLGSHSFMAGRVARSQADLKDRMTHWQDGLSLLRTPADWLLGLGAGRLPAHYSKQVPGGEFPGRAQWQRQPDGHAVVRLSGPPSRQDLAYDFGLTQRVDLAAHGHYRVRLRYQTDAPLVLLVSVCERHLLYDFRCQWKHVRPQTALTDPDRWHDISLAGPTFAAAGRATAWRDGMFAVTVLSPGHTATLHAAELIAPDGRQVLRNTDFSTGLQRWFPAAQGHFKPWHMDSLYLEVLIERGLLGCLVFGLLMVCSLRRAWASLKSGEPLALVLAGSLVAMGVLGIVISVTELPRIAFLLLLILLTTSQLQRKPQYSRL